MKNHKLSLLVLLFINVALMATVLFLRFDNYAKWVDVEDYNQAINAANNNLEYQKNIMKYQFYTEQRQIPSTARIITEKADTLLLAEQVMAPVLVLRYSELHCQPCVDALIASLKQEETLNASNTLILAYYQNPAYMHQFKRTNRLQLPVFSIRNTTLPPDTLNVPYFFLLHENLKVSHVFIPQESDTAGVRFYLNFIGKTL